MNNLNPYTVIYVDRRLNIWEGFNCMAEDSDRAQEQCENAYPDVDVIWVNEGHDVLSMEEMEEPDDPL